MKLTFISDTHGFHEKLNIEPCDILFHSGDISTKGSYTQTMSFFNWFAKQTAMYKVFVVGNHDSLFNSHLAPILHHQIPADCIYLENSGVEINGLKIWGTPVTPLFNNNAFNVNRGAAIARYWDMIPNDTDILLTHGPAHGILDCNISGKHTGCEELYNTFKGKKIKYHAFGHIHEARGVTQVQWINHVTTHINAASVDYNQKVVYPGISFLCI